MLESYIAPLFTGYVDKYIKNLKPGDLSLSLWGGDVVLQNLELNLDVLQQEINLPITFLSGKIHKFQLHVPWTRLIYEPVVITIDTMEFIVKLKDPGDVTAEHNEEENDKTSLTEAPDTQFNNADTSTQEQMPPGYVQGILNKVVNNVSFKINNIIIKYVEDDIVFSLNVKSVDFYCVDDKWEHSFIDLALPELVLRKLCNITDLTVCLDHRNTSGKIELYQDPVLYKCNLTCRIKSRYRGLSSSKPIENKVDVFCERFDFSLTDLQIPMVLRLLNLVIGLFYGTLDLPGCSFKKHTAPAIIEKHKNNNASSNNVSGTATTTAVEANPDDSWSSWAWSMVPGMSTAVNEEETSFKEDIKFCFGLFVSNVTFILKSTNQSSDILASQRLEFSPRMCLELSGVVMEFLTIGDLFIDVNMGVSSILGYIVGNQCICNADLKQLDETIDEFNEDEVFLKIGEKNVDENTLLFLKDSLFTDLLPASLDSSQDISPGEKQFNASELKDGFPVEHVPQEKLHDVFVKDAISGSKLSDEEILSKYGTLFLNYNYEMSLPDLTAGDIENIFLYPETDEVVPEVSEKRLFLSSCQLYVSTTLVHSLSWLSEICSAKLPQRKVKPDVFLDPFVLQQLQLGNLLSRQMSLTVLNSVAYIFPRDHKRGTCHVNAFQEEKEAVCVQVDSCKLVKVDPMYPLELSSLLKDGKIIKLNQNMKNLNSLVSVEVTGLQSGLSLINQETLGDFTLNILQPVDFNASVKSTFLPEDVELAFPVINSDYHFECNQTSLLFTKLHLLLCYNILSSWATDHHNKELIRSLVQSVFHPGGCEQNSSVPLINVQITGSSFQMIDMNDLSALIATVQRINATAQSLDRTGSIENVELFAIPCQTSKFSDINAYQNIKETNTSFQSAVQLTAQWQKSKNSVLQILSLKAAGSCLNFDVVLYDWISEKPSSNKVKKSTSTSTKPSVLTKQSSRLGSHPIITTPKRTKSYARMFGGSTTSPSQHSKDKEQETNINNKLEVAETQKEAFGEWLAQKINFFKSFHINVDIGAFVLIVPEKAWPKGFGGKEGIIKAAMNSIHQQQQRNNHPASLVICFPKLIARSSHAKEELFQQPIPILQDKTHLRKMDTLPWTITSSDFAILSLFPSNNGNNVAMGDSDKVESVYICKPMSWKIYLAAAPSNNSVSRNVTKLGNISEQNDVFYERLPDASSAPSTGHHIASPKSSQDVAKLKHTIGFVIHADWSVCALYISENQMKLVVNISKNIYHSFESFMESKQQIQAETFSHKHGHRQGNLHTNRDPNANADLLSQSSRSTIDLPDNFSSLTGSSNVVAKVASHREVDVSLWIQCTLPKVKLSILSNAKQPGVYYQVTSEIDEIMFAFDYQDNTLELTNKISSFMVYYSMLRFDADPVGWVSMKNGFMFCQKDKRDSSHIDSNTFLSVQYRRTQQVTPSNIQHTSPATNLGVAGGLLQAANSVGETVHTIASSVISIEEELVIKHEINISVKSFDLICVANPVLCSVGVFTSALKNCIGFSSSAHQYSSQGHHHPQQQTQQLQQQNLHQKQKGPQQTTTTTAATTEVSKNIVTWPITTVYCDSIRVLMPYSDVPNNKQSIISDDEQLLLLHLNSMTLISSPVNPITKTVVDKVAYQQLKQCYREPMKKLKLWNVQYQLDISNIGLCTTSWKSVQSSLPENKTMLGEENSQNPAVEWNSQLCQEQHKITPIFMGFDLKATIAPPLMLQLNNKSVHAVTTAAVEYHSPRPIRLYINSSQIALSLQLLDDANALLTELSSILDTQPSFEVKPPITDSILEVQHPNSQQEHHQQHTDSGINTLIYEEKPDSAEKSSNSSMLPAVELFGSISNISVILYHRKEEAVSQQSRSAITTATSATVATIIPVLALTLSQPTCSLNTLNTPRFQFTLLDVFVSTSSLTSGIQADVIIPQLQSYDTTVLSCAKGESNKQSGLLPTFIKFSLTIPQPGDIVVDAVIEKSVFVKFNYNLLSNLMVFKEALSKIHTIHKEGVTDEHGMDASLKEEPHTVQPSFRLSEVNARTNQLHVSVSMSPSSADQEIALCLHYHNLDVKSKLNFCDKTHKLNRCNLNTSIDGLNFDLSNNGKKNTFLMPVNIVTEIKLIPGFITGNTVFPDRFYVKAECGVVEVAICQQLYHLLNILMSEFTETTKSLFASQDDDEITQDVRSDKERINIDLSESVDDLRSGKFTYNLLKDSKEGMIAEPNQIVFSSEDDHITPIMAWCYTEPRIITEICVLPVPFYMPEELKRTSEEGGVFEIFNVRCYLQCLEELDEKYITCCAFDLSENDSTRLIIADKNNLMADNVRPSQYWRVVIGTSQNIESLNVKVDPGDFICPVSPVLSTSLAACLKINSCTSPRLVSSLELNMAASLLQITICNDTSSSSNMAEGRHGNKPFQDFFFDKQVAPDFLEALKISFRDLNTSFSLVSNLKVDLQVVTKLDVSVMDFKNLCWIDLITPTELKCHVVKALLEQFTPIPECIDLETNVDVFFEEGDVLISQSAVHTLLLASNAWSSAMVSSGEEVSSGDHEESLRVFNHYVLCNQTQDCIHIQQMGTDEDIVLQSGQLYPYSWCSKEPYQLRFCLESANDWKWSKPFHLNEEGVQTRQLEHKGFSSVIFIEVKRIGGVQKQVIFHGCCTFMNNLTMDLDMEVITQETDHSIAHLHRNLIDVSRKFTMETRKPTRSLTVSHHFIKKLRIFTCGQQQHQQQEQQQQAEIKFPSNEDDADISTTIMINNQPSHVWVCLRPNDAIPGQKVISVSPMYIVRNLLSEPVLLNICTRDNDERYDILSDGKGIETEIFQLHPCKWFNFSFALPGASDCSKPPLAMNTTMSKLLQENNSICNEEFNQKRWPYFDHIEQNSSKKSSSTHKISYQAERKPKSPGPENIRNTTSMEAELHFQASLRWPKLPSILIDLKPSLLICNLSGMELLVKGMDTGCLYKLAPRKCLSPFYIKELLTLGLRVDDKELWSLPLRLGMRTSNFQDTTILEECIKAGSTTQVSVFDQEHVTCFQFSFKFIRSDGVYIVTIKERFLIHNLSSSDFFVTSLMFNRIYLSQSLQKGCVFELQKNSQLPFALLNIMKNVYAGDHENNTELNNKEKEDLTGLAVHFELNPKSSAGSVEERVEKSWNESCKTHLWLPMKDHVIKKRNTLLLSEDHLREWICLHGETSSDDVNKSTTEPIDKEDKYLVSGKPFVLTSILDNDVINIFIEEDHHSIVNITNNLTTSLVIKEISTSNNQSNKHYDILEADHNKLTCLPSARVSYIQPTNFKALFPKTSNVLELRCQFGVFAAGDAIELSKPVSLGKDGNTKVFVPELGEIYFGTFIRNSQLFVNINVKNKTKQTESSRPLSLPPFRIRISSLDLMLIDSNTNRQIEGVLSLSISSLSLLHDVGVDSEYSKFKLTVGGVQLDNQLQDACYHFPVILLPMRELSQRYHTVTSDAPFPDLEACLDADFCSIVLTVGSHDHDFFDGADSSVYVNSIQVKLQPCEMYLEDTFVYRLSEVLGSYVPVWIQKKELLQQQNLHENLLAAVSPILHPLRVCSIDIDETSVLLSIHASVKMFVAADHIPLRLGRFKCNPTQTVNEEFARTLLYHYATQVLVRVGWILGSLDIIGNPTGLIHSVGRGLSDFFIMPYQGLTRGPTAFVSGISHGITSFLRHVSTGTLTSITNVSSSISRNMDRLCLDETHLQLQEQRRAQVPTRAVTGLQNAFGSLGISLLGAVAGLVDHSIQNIAAANSTTEAVTGLVTGFAKGVVGVVAKPIGGAMEFVSQTSLGILQGTGLVRVPERISLLEFDSAEDLGREESNTKFIWQFLHLKNSFDVFATPCTIQNTCKERTEQGTDTISTASSQGAEMEDANNINNGVLILTQAALFLFDQQVSNIVSAFPFKEIEIIVGDVNSKDDVMSVKLFKRMEPSALTNRMSLDENPNFRHFFESFQEASVLCEAERLYENISTNDKLILEVEIPKTYALLFKTRYNANKTHMEDAIMNLDEPGET